MLSNKLFLASALLSSAVFAAGSTWMKGGTSIDSNTFYNVFCSDAEYLKYSGGSPSIDTSIVPDINDSSTLFKLSGTLQTKSGDSVSISGQTVTVEGKGSGGRITLKAGSDYLACSGDGVVTQDKETEWNYGTIAEQ